MRREPRLQFTKEERENPALEKPIRKVDRAADRADEAQVKVPKRKVKQRTVDPETGAVTVRLQFEDKKPPSKLQHALRDAPADTVLGAVHREVRQSEADNVGVESAHKTEEAAESAGRLVRAGYRSQKLRPYPYVWGGSSPSTSFDCSGYVSWVLNHSGWDVGRLGAQGLCNICTPVTAANAKPGDLVFFKGTYDTPGVSHCGIYVGNGMMIHCGSPISYANLNTSYWQEHLYCYGRLP